DGIWDKSLFLGWDSITKPETAASMPHIKNDAASMGLGEGGIELSVGKNNGKLLSEYVSVNVAWPHFLENQVLVSSLRSRPEIVHDGNIRERGAFDRTVNRTPRH